MPAEVTPPVEQEASKETPIESVAERSFGEVETPETPEAPVEQEEPDDSGESVEELKRKLTEARKDAEKKRRQKTEAQKSAGQYEELYNETATELQQAQTQVETLTTELDASKKQIKTMQKELDNYRASLIERFESDADKELAKDTPLAKIPALYERLYGRGMITAPPSQGATRTATRTPEEKPLTREQELAKHYGVSLSA